jgi:UDP-4-amino-4,6-dideoxy-N-acetyl-beta-L-altrosamine N-acetyltransferase
MKILYLGLHNEELASFLKEDGHQILEKESPIDVQFFKETRIDFVISYGYRHIIKPEVLHFMSGRVINLHVSYLPWNRGADPNLWSFLEDTPKGVTIHYVDEGIDTGDIINQKELFFEPESHTLATTYEQLQKEMIGLFKRTWPLIDITGGGAPRLRQAMGGTMHRISDKRYFKRLLVKGWETPVSDILGKGRFYLRVVREEDKELIHSWRNSPNVAKYMYTDHRISEGEHERWFDAAIKDSSRKYWIIVYDNEAIGLANLYDMDSVNKRCFWAFYIASRKVRGKGVGSLVEYHILSYVFEDLGFNKLCCEVLSFNQSVIEMHKSFGFQQEGLYRQHRVKNGNYIDVVALAMLRREWDAHKPQIEMKLKAKEIL